MVRPAKPLQYPRRVREPIPGMPLLEQPECRLEDLPPHILVDSSQYHTGTEFSFLAGILGLTR